MAQNKNSKVSVEEELTTLNKHFGGIAATVKALMDKVLKNDIKEIVESFNLKHRE